MTQELSDVIEQTVSFVRLRRTSRRATAAEARAALTVEEMLEKFRRQQQSRVTTDTEKAEVAA